MTGAGEPRAFSGRGQGCRQTAHSAQDSPRTRGHWAPSVPGAEEKQPWLRPWGASCSLAGPWPLRVRVPGCPLPTQCCGVIHPFPRPLAASSQGHNGGKTRSLPSVSHSARGRPWCTGPPTTLGSRAIHHIVPGAGGQQMFAD